jgi:hypothetical protein
MHNFVKHFYREGRGRWTCLESCDFSATVGNIHVASGTMIHRGYSINDFDLAAHMDAEYDRQQRAHRH